MFFSLFFYFSVDSLGRKECFYDSPPPCQRRFQNRFRTFSPSFLSFLLVRPVHMVVIVNVFFFNLAAGSSKYSSLSGSCNRRFGGGGFRRNTRSYLTNPFLSTFFSLCAQVSLVSHIASTTIVRLFALILLSSALPNPGRNPVLFPVSTPVPVPVPGPPPRLSPFPASCCVCVCVCVCIY